MNNQNKVLMSLLTASISALAAAPALAGEKEKIIDVNEIGSKNKSTKEISPEAKKDIKNQVNAMLSKKTPTVQIAESIDIVTDNYGKDKDTIKKKVFKDLKLGVTQDSTNVGTVGVTYNTGGTQSACHSVCHSACHGACHGARGWR